MSGPSDNGKKRRLPTWMLGACTTDKQIKDGNTDGRCSSLEEEPNPQLIDLKVKAINRKHDRLEISKDIAESKVLAESRKSTRRTRKRSRKAENKDLPESEVLGESHKSTRRTSKRGRQAEGKLLQGVGEAGPVKKNKESAGCWRTRDGKDLTQNLKYTGQKSSKGDATVEESEDEVELTVDDLIDIAREYINANKEHDIRSSTRTHTSEVHASSLSFSSNTDSGLPLPSNESIKNDVSSCTRLTSGSYSSDFSKEKGIAANKDTFNGIAKSGDVAQDMLDLFLGPLLRKIPSTSRDDKISETEVVVSTCESHNQLNSKGTLNEEVPFMKKKSSLKDKVVMFLE